MTSFLEVLVKSEKLHELPRRTDLLERGRFVDNTWPFPRRLAVRCICPAFRHCVVAVGVLLLLDRVEPLDVQLQRKGCRKRPLKMLAENSRPRLAESGRCFKKNLAVSAVLPCLTAGAVNATSLDTIFAWLQGIFNNLTGAHRGATAVAICAESRSRPAISPYILLSLANGR